MNDPALAQAQNAAGMAAIRAGDLPEAIAAFDRAVEADPTALPLLSNLAHAHRLAGNSGEERAALERALALDRLDFGAQLRMAQLLQRIGEEAQALVAWAGVVQLASQITTLASHIQEEVEAGRAYSTALQNRISEKLDAALGPQESSWGETDNRRIRAFIDGTLGRRRVFHNQCAGVLYPFLPEDEFFDRHHFPWFAELEAHHTEIRAELDALLADPGAALRPYVRMEQGTPQNDWTALDHSLDWGACFLWEYGLRNEVVTQRCPKTAALIERLPLAPIPGRAPNVFFSILQPGKRIPPHTGVTNTRAIVHLALDVPPGCGFRVGNETREWVEGTAFAFDDTIEHEAWNTSDRPRAVLILDSWNPHLSERERMAIVDYFDATEGALVGTPLPR